MGWPKGEGKPVIVAPHSAGNEGPASLQLHQAQPHETQSFTALIQYEPQAIEGRQNGAAAGSNGA